MKSIKNHFAKNINTKNTTPPQQGRFVNKTFGKTFNKTSGFTIIEVALVLAIAGLIFLVVFLALPALQNSQKDTARRQDVGRVVAALQAYEADNNGNSPASSTAAWYGADGSTTSGLGGYLGKFGSEINGVWMAASDINGNTDGMTAANSGTSINVYPGHFCPGDTRTASPSDASVGVVLSSGKVYCASM